MAPAPRPTTAGPAPDLNRTRGRGSTRPHRAGWIGAIGAVAAAAVALAGAGTAIADDDDHVPVFIDTLDRGYEEVVGLLAEEGVVNGCAPDRFCPDSPVTRGQIATLLAAALDLDQADAPIVDGDAADADAVLDADGDVGPVDDGGLDVVTGTSPEPDADADPDADAELDADADADGDADPDGDADGDGDALTGSPEPDRALPFDDIEGSVHVDAIVAIARAGITNGCGDGAYCTDDTITREQLASMLVQAFEVPPTDVVAFDDAVGGTHGANINALAAAGIAAGCTDPLTHFCGTDPVLRWHAAAFVARAMSLVDPVSIAPLEERREQQEHIDEARREAERQRAEQERIEAERAERAEQERIYAERAAQRLAMWERLAQCESNGRWNMNSGNGYYGGLQFHIQTWRSVGGSGYPHQASKSEQIYRAELLLQKPWATFGNQWPACSRRLGLA